MKKYISIIFFIILLIAIGVRFYNLENQGFMSWDEGMYMNEALFYKSIITNIPFLINSYTHGTLNNQTLTDTIDGWPPSSAKPFHSFLIFITTLFFGMNVYAAKVMSAIFGILTIILLFYIVSLWYGRSIALISILFLASSGYHIYVSRLGVPETNSAFFYIVGMFLYWKSTVSNDRNTRYLFFAGIMLGLSFITCYRWIAVLPIFWLNDFILCLKSKNIIRKKYLARFITFTLSFITLPLICDIPYIPIRFLGAITTSFRHMPQLVYGYADQLFFYILFQSHKGTLSPHALYIDFFYKLNGIPMTLLSLVGIFFLLKRITLKNYLMCGPVIILFCLLSLKTRGNSIRYISLALPFMAVLAAVALVNIVAFIRCKKGIALGICAVTALCVSFLSVHNVIPIIFINSGYVHAMDYLKEQGGAKHLSTTNVYSEFYFGRNIPEQTPSTIHAMKNILDTNVYSFVVLDFMSHRVLRKLTKDTIENNCIPVARFHNSIGNNYFTLIESLAIDHENARYIPDALNDLHAAFIDIYSAEDVRNVFDTINS